MADDKDNFTLFDACGHLSKMAEALAEKNVDFDYATVVDPATLRVVGTEVKLALRKRDPRIRANKPWVTCRFCPFCGKELRPTKTERNWLDGD